MERIYPLLLGYGFEQVACIRREEGVGKAILLFGFHGVIIIEAWFFRIFAFHFPRLVEDCLMTEAGEIKQASPFDEMLWFDISFLQYRDPPLLQGYTLEITQLTFCPRRSKVFELVLSCSDWLAVH